MVWVSNQSAVEINVQITANSGGDPGVFVIPPAGAIENRAINYWTRTGNEVATITLAGGGPNPVQVTSNALVEVFAGSVFVTPNAPITRFP
jgi:hypothetical protein